MKKFIETLKGAYSGAWCKWLFASVASMTVLPFFIKTAALFIKKEALGVGWPLLAEVAGLLAALTFAVLALQSVDDGKHNALRVAANGVLPLFAVLYGGSLILFLVQTYLYPLITAAWLKISASLLIYAGISVAAAFFLAGIICRIKKAGLSHKVITMIAVTLALFVGYHLLGNFAATAVKLLRNMNGGVMIPAFARLVGALARLVCLVPAIAFLAHKCEKVEKTEDTVNEESAGKPSIARFVPAVIFAVVLAASLIVVLPFSLSPQSSIKTSYENKAAEALAYLKNGDYVTAVWKFDNYSSELKALEMILNQESLAEIAKENPGNSVIAYLDAASAEDESLEKLEKLYIGGTAGGSDFCFALLKAYKDAEELTAAQKNRQQSILSALAAVECYTGGMISPDSLDKEKTQQTIEELRKLDKGFMYAGLLKQTQISDSTNDLGIHSKTMKEAIKLANDNPEDIVYQWLAVSLLDGYDNLENNGDIAKAMPEIIKRYDAAFEKEMKPDAEEDEIKREQRLITRCYLRLQEYLKAAEFAEKTDAELKSSYYSETAMLGYLYGGNPDKALSCAEKVLDNDKDNVQALFYAGVSCMLKDHYSEALSYGVRLAELAQNSRSQEADDLLFQYVMYLTVDDDAIGEKMGSACYTSLSESERKRMEACDYLNTYIKAFTGSARERQEDRKEDDLDEAETYVQHLLELNPEVAYTNYVSVMLLMRQKKYEEAKAACIKAIEYQPGDAMLWYVYSSCCEALKDWQGAYNAAKTAYDMNPWGEGVTYFWGEDAHNDDWYGIGMHADEIMDYSMGQLMKEGE